MSGTLTIPSQPKSAVVLLSGSGPSDRDQTILEHRSFAVLAKHLYDADVAVLRYDDRGVGKSDGAYPGSTSFDFATDAAAAYEYLRDNLDADVPIGFLGHSEGGIIAQIADSIVGGVDFHIYMASPGMDVIDMMVEQNRLFFASGIGQEQANIYASGLKEVFEAVISKGEPSAKQEKINQLAKTLYNQLDPEQAKKIAPSDMFYAMNMNALQHNAWMTYFLNYQPSKYLQYVRCPILALNGSKDIQVVPDNLASIKEHATQSEVTTVELPDHNHLFQRCITGNVKEYAIISHTLDKALLDEITSWLVDRGWSK